MYCTMWIYSYVGGFQLEQVRGISPKQHRETPRPRPPHSGDAVARTKCFKFLSLTKAFKCFQMLPRHSKARGSVKVVVRQLTQKMVRIQNRRSADELLHSNGTRWDGFQCLTLLPGCENLIWRAHVILLTRFAFNFIFFVFFDLLYCFCCCLENTGNDYLKTHKQKLGQKKLWRRLPPQLGSSNKAQQSSLWPLVVGQLSHLLRTQNELPSPRHLQHRRRQWANGDRSFPGGSVIRFHQWFHQWFYDFSMISSSVEFLANWARCVGVHGAWSQDEQR